MTIWHYLINQAQNGPVSEADLSALLHAGGIQPSTMVWAAHLPQWQPLSQALPHLAPQAPASAAIPPPAPFAAPPAAPAVPFASSPPVRSSWLKKTAIAFAALVVLSVLGWFGYLFMTNSSAAERAERSLGAAGLPPAALPAKINEWLLIRVYESGAGNYFNKMSNVEASVDGYYAQFMNPLSVELPATISLRRFKDAAAAQQYLQEFKTKSLLPGTDEATGYHAKEKQPVGDSPFLDRFCLWSQGPVVCFIRVEYQDAAKLASLAQAYQSAASIAP